MTTESINEFIDLIIEEDIKDGDHTSLSCIPAEAEDKAQLIIKDDGVLAGVELAKMIFKRTDPELEMEVLIPDGSRVKYGDIGFYVNGKTQSILRAERLVLNCMQRMSGIATMTRKFVDLVAEHPAKVLDTRKTTPGMRQLEKWAVRIGGGHNHRMGLYDMIMIKDNHHDYAGGITKAIERTQVYLKEKQLNIKVEIEVRNLSELQEVLEVGQVDRIMLDNFEPKIIVKALKMIKGQYETEASGGINLDTIESYAQTGVDFISVGALTHSYKSMDISLKAIK